jgi:hypothetical protein
MSGEINRNRDAFRRKVRSAEISLKRSVKCREKDEEGKMSNLSE